MSAPGGHYRTNEQIKFRKWHIDQDRVADGLEPMYATHEKSAFDPDAPAKRKSKTHRKPACHPPL